MYSPPYNGVQVLEGDMVVHVKELQKAVEKSTFGHCTQSIPFPSFSIDQGVQFQIQLYPVGLGNLSSPSCAVYLVVLGWSPDRRVPILPKFEININVSPYLNSMYAVSLHMLYKCYLLYCPPHACRYQQFSRLVCPQRERM